MEFVTPGSLPFSPQAGYNPAYNPSSPYQAPSYLQVPGQQLHRSRSVPSSPRKPKRNLSPRLKKSPYPAKSVLFQEPSVAPFIGANQSSPLPPLPGFQASPYPGYANVTSPAYPLSQSSYIPFQQPIQQAPYPEPFFPPQGPPSSQFLPSPYPGAGYQAYNQPSSTVQNPYTTYNPNAPWLRNQKESALVTHIHQLRSKVPQAPIDVTNDKTRFKNALPQELATKLTLLDKSRSVAASHNKPTSGKAKKEKAKEQPTSFSGYKFNPRAFETPFHKNKTMNYLQIVTHQTNSATPVYEYLLLRPFHPSYVSPTGLRLEIGYDREADQYYSKLVPNVDPTRAPDYVGVRNIGVVTDEKAFFAVANFLPVPMVGGRHRRPLKGERDVPLETFRGWSSLLIMESRHRGILLQN